MNLRPSKSQNISRRIHHATINSCHYPNRDVRRFLKALCVLIDRRKDRRLKGSVRAQLVLSGLRGIPSGRVRHCVNVWLLA